MEAIVSKTIEYVKKELRNAEGGHDWWHVYRVWKLAERMALEETADLLTVELAALLHDIADSKFHDGDEEIGPRKAEQFLRDQHLDNDRMDHIVAIIRNMSFKNSFEPSSFSSLELDIVSDADRLDAMGAIGIARTFNYGGHKGFPLYDPEIKPVIFQSKEEYKKSHAPTLNHFYEKLLLLKDMMCTQTGKKLAEERHRFMQEYLEQFYAEWEGEK